jgi:hypothetical protein
LSVITALQLQLVILPLGLLSLRLKKGLNHIAHFGWGCLHHCLSGWGYDSQLVLGKKDTIKWRRRAYLHVSRPPQQIAAVCSSVWAWCGVVWCGVVGAVWWGEQNKPRTWPLHQTVASPNHKSNSKKKINKQTKEIKVSCTRPEERTGSYT